MAASGEAALAVDRRQYIDRHILPTFGTMKFIEILPIDVRQWVVGIKARGASPQSSGSATRSSAIFTIALNDQIIQLHPCHPVKTPPIRQSVLTIEQLDDLYTALSNETSRLLAKITFTDHFV